MFMYVYVDSCVHVPNFAHIYAHRAHFGDCRCFQHVCVYMIGHNDILGML